MPHTSSYRRILYKMGYYNYQEGLIYRHLNQHNGWDSHLKHCRDFIMKAIDLEKPAKVTVLGSGWLMELPIAELAEKIEKICLVDIVHPPEVISQTSALKNVELFEDDVSGGLIIEVWEKAGKCRYFNRLSSLEDIEIPEYQLPDDPGLVVSLNILTQLESLPERLLRKRVKVTEDAYNKFKRNVQEKHIRFLGKHHSLLISDVSELSFGKDGRETESGTLIATLPGGKMEEEWIWNFDLAGYDYYQKRSVLKVRAILF